MFKTAKLYRILALFYIYGLLLYTLVALDYYSHPPLVGLIGLGSIASSTFILLVRPKSSASRTKNIILSYLFAIFVGIVYQQIIIFFNPHFDHHMPIHFQSLSVMAVVTIIVIFRRFKIDHPPAVGMTVGLVLESWHYMTILVLISSVTGLLLIPVFFKRIIFPKKRNHLTK